jgi:translation initiation factor 5
LFELLVRTMSVINIRGTTAVDDPEYRYKMPAIMGKVRKGCQRACRATEHTTGARVLPLSTQVEGRGNGIKTAIPNMTQLAASLHREPGEVTKFFGTELGAQTTWTAETERAIVNGAHTTPDLQASSKSRWTP